MEIGAFGASLKSSFSNAWMVPENTARKLFFLERKTFLRRLRVMAMAKMPLADALDELCNSAKENHRGIMYAALQSMLTRQRRGRSFSETLAGWFAPADIMLMEAGEQQGGNEHLAAAIDEVIEMQGATKEMAGYVLAGLFEPTVMLLAIYALIAWLAGTFTTEVLTTMSVNPERLTGTARQFYLVGRVATSIWVYIIPVLTLVFLLLVFLSLPGIEFKTRSGKTRLFTSRARGVLDRIVPPWSIYAQMVSCRWLLAFAKLAKAHYTYEVILHRTAGLASPWMRERIQAVEVSYRKGLTLGRAMKRTGYRFPSDELIEDVSVFANRPNFEESLEVIAKEWVREVTARVKMLAFALTASGFLATTVSMIWIMDAFNQLQVQVTATSEQQSR